MNGTSASCHRIPGGCVLAFAISAASMVGGLEASASFIDIDEVEFKTKVNDVLTPVGSPFIDTFSSPLTNTFYHSSGTATGNGDFEFYSAFRYQNETGKRTFGTWLQTLDQFTSGAGVVDPAEITIKGRFTDTADDVSFGFTDGAPEAGGMEFGSGRATMTIGGVEYGGGENWGSGASDVAGKSFRFRIYLTGANSATAPGTGLPDLPTAWGFIEKAEGDTGPVPGPGALAALVGVRGLARRRRR